VLNLRAALREVCPAALVRPDLLERDSRKTFERLVGWIDHDPYRLKRCHAQKRFCSRGGEDDNPRYAFRFFLRIRSISVVRMNIASRFPEWRGICRGRLRKFLVSLAAVRE